MNATNLKGKELQLRAITTRVLGTALSLLLLACNQVEANSGQVLVYKSPTCGCCTKWERHLETNGFSVTSEKRTDMDEIKNEAQVPAGVRACHTALVNGYVVEGHVPASDIKRLLDERPDILGLAVPGMPLGSPGMEATRSEPYDVLAVRTDGTHEVFARHRP